jgi:hypothetical protein
MVADPDEGPLEERLPGYRYGIVLLLLFGTFVLESAGFEGTWARTGIVAFQGATLVAAFSASGVNRHLMRIATGVAIAALIVSVIAASTDSEASGALFSILSFLLVVAAPVVIARAIIRRGVVDIHTVLGALCIYVMVGMLFAFLYGTIDNVISEPFFAQTTHASSADYLYFSFVTLTTTGYGDLTAAGDLGRAVSVLEALSGQLYLVTIVSLLVAQMATSALPHLRQRQDAAAAPPDPAAAPPDPE